MTSPVPGGGELLHEIRCLITDLPRFGTAPFDRRRHLRWGGTDEEIRASMPGDERYRRGLAPSRDLDFDHRAHR
jgi:hypothetical protein